MTDTAREYSTTQVDIDDARVVALVKAVQARLDPDDVVELEQAPHVTVRFGLHGDDPSEVARVARGNGPLMLHLKRRLSVFSNDDADVLKFDVESSELERLNERLGKLPNTQTHETYQPHLTVAYLKPGTGDKYLRLRPRGQYSVGPLDKMAFSDKKREKTSVALAYGSGSQQERLKKLEALARAGILTGEQHKELVKLRAKFGRGLALAAPQGGYSEFEFTDAVDAENFVIEAQFNSRRVAMSDGTWGYAEWASPQDRSRVEQIARKYNGVRASWACAAPKVTKAQVAALRKKSDVFKKSMEGKPYSDKKYATWMELEHEIRDKEATLSGRLDSARCVELGAIYQSTHNKYSALFKSAFAKIGARMWNSDDMLPLKGAYTMKQYVGMTMNDVKKHAKPVVHPLTVLDSWPEAKRSKGYSKFLAEVADIQRAGEAEWVSILKSL